METITLNGITYDVTTEGETIYGITYKLTGPRGAEYFTTRNRQHSDLMFLVSFGKRVKSGMKVDPLGANVWLTDRTGSLTTESEARRIERAQTASK
jgi:hypothetical protein